MKLRLLCAVLGLSAALAATPAQAAPLLDCPMRDAPFSVDGPFVDVMLSERAKAAITAEFPTMLTSLPPIMSGTKSPTFGSIMTVRKLTGFMGGAAPDLTKLDAALRALPVNDGDRIVRCARYDNERPTFERAPKGKVRVLLFEKMTGFKDTPSVEAANAAFKAMATRKGWHLAVTDKGGAMNAATLRQFDAVIWNNISGDVLTLTQRKAFESYIKRGGGFVGVHGSAGDPVYFWDWYPDTLLGARFIGHPSDPQFQDAKVQIEKTPSGVGADLAPGWTMKDEWYSFAKSARLNGSTVIATLDEGSYAPGKTRFGGPPLNMGADHPIAWTRCVGNGRSYYSAIGHMPATYSDANHVKLFEQAILWASGKGATRCSAGREVAR